jgi:hypothetical protein
VLGEIFGYWAYKADLTGVRRRLHNNGAHIALFLAHIESGNNSVGIATCYGPYSPVFESTKGKTFVSFPNPPRPGLGPSQPHMQWLPRS